MFSSRLVTGSSLVTSNVYVFVSPFSEVTITFIIFKPFFKLTIPSPLTSAFTSSTSVFIFISSVSYGTLSVYLALSLLNSGFILYPSTSSDFKFAFLLPRRLTFTLYILSLPLSLVTFTSISFKPFCKLCIPFPLRLDVYSSGEAVTTILSTSFSTSKLYSLVPLLKLGLILYPSTPKLFK